MAELSQEVERVVREVLASMGLAPTATESSCATACRGTTSNPSLLADRGSAGQLGQAVSPGGAGPDNKLSQAVAHPSSTQQAKRASGDLVIQSRVVTLKDLPERLDRVRRLIVPPRAVVTPSVRDLARRYHVAVVHATHEMGATNNGSGLKVPMILTGTSYDPAPLVKVLTDEGYNVATERLDCLIASTDRMKEEFRGGLALGLLLTRHAAAAMCLANRLAGIRAVRGTKAEEVAAESAAIGANVLVADPEARGFFPMRQLVVQFLRGGPRECPKVFCDRLG